MLVKELNEQKVGKIGHAFGYYDYGKEKGLVSCYRSQEAAAVYINGYVRMAVKGGLLHTTSEKGEAYIAYNFIRNIEGGINYVSTKYFFK